MNNNFSMSFITDHSLKEVFEVILDVRSWWSGIHNETIEGESNVLGKEFTFTAGGGMHYSKHRLIQAKPFEKIVWEVTDARLSFVKDGGEWNGTKLCFDIASDDGQTTVKFTHEGLVPELKCYYSCSTTWSRYINEKLISRLQLTKHVPTN
jgi:hypothetical protein